MNSAAFGMSVQKLICEEYNIEPNEQAKNQYKANYSSRYDDVKILFSKIFDEVGAKPIKCLTFEKENGMQSPHNFLLDNKMTLSVKTTFNYKNSKVAPQVVGQAGYDKLNYHFSHLCENKIESKDDIKEFIWNKVAKAMPIFIDYLFVSDIILWIYIEKGKYNYKIIYRNEKPDLKWAEKSFSFTKKNIQEWNESVTLKYNNLSIAEIQVHKNRNFKFRFILDKLITLFNVREKNNETLGISIENAICETYNLKKPKHLDYRSDRKIMEEVKPTILEVFSKIPTPIKYVGDDKGSRGGQSKSPVDFILTGNKTLSLKTNVGSRVCPPEIGQPSLETFKLHFSYLIENVENFTSEKFKELVIERPEVLLNEYLKYLLDCDYLLWIYKRKDSYNYKILSREMNFNFIKDNISFTRNLENWNESNTVKYNGVTIGEFQVHKKRNSLKFRFEMKNLVDLLTTVN